VDFAADFAGALHLLLRGFHDHVSGAHAFGGRGAVLGDVDDDNTFHILGDRKLLLQLGRDARQCQTERPDNPGRLFATLPGRLLRSRLLLIALLKPADLDLEGGFAALTPNYDRHCLVDRRLGDEPRQPPHIPHRLAVKAYNNIAGLDAGHLCGPILVDASNQRPTRLVEPETFGDLVGDGLDTHPEPAAMDG